MATGQGVEVDKDELEWEYDWNLNENYKLLLSIATDSAENFSLYSGYAWLPKEAQWKLLGTCKIEGRWSGIKEPSLFYSNGSKNKVGANAVAAWVQRSNGSWKNLQNQNLPNPVALVSNHVDSLVQLNMEIARIEKAMQEGKIEKMEQVEGVYYKILKEGTGPAVSVNDTVVAFYKGYLFEDGLVFDQTKENPATFPLKRLIKGWQLGVPMCKVGGKIKLVIPSALAYSIRTRAAKIPPNSILVFEIEIVSVKPSI
jgi:FKBP-type peptidyl-prolyl cis-trans isomerases 1